MCEAVEYRRSVYANDPKYKARHKQALKRKKHQRIFTYVHEDNYQLQVSKSVHLYYESERCLTTEFPGILKNVMFRDIC